VFKDKNVCNLELLDVKVRYLHAIKLNSSLVQTTIFISW